VVTAGEVVVVCAVLAVALGVIVVGVGVGN
jgi:hypothetical protein